MNKRYALFAAALLLGSGIALAAGPAPPKGTTSITLPGEAGASFKPGAGGVAAAQSFCLSCHSSAYVAMQPVLNTAQWTAEVNKMKAVYGAPIPDDQVPAIVSYLVTEYGRP